MCAIFFSYLHTCEENLATVNYTMNFFSVLVTMEIGNKFCIQKVNRIDIQRVVAFWIHQGSSGSKGNAVGVSNTYSQSRPLLQGSLTHTILHFGFYAIEKIHYLSSLFLLFHSPFKISIYVADSAMLDFDDSTDTFEMKAEILITLILIHIIF